ncbi:MAG: hypothetical protein U5R30_15190 [Deltaproteobacteria bacterium]|nr:hypothetical protein [Deltaproteobacteria bacterium]
MTTTNWFTHWLPPGEMQALLYAIDYESYLLTNDGATLIHIDTDRNPNTGWAITNLASTTTIGADSMC